MTAHLGKNGPQRGPSLLSSIVAMLLLTAVCFAAYWLGNRAGGRVESVSPDESGLVADPRFLDFGEVWEDADFHWKLPIRNVTAQVIEILDFVTSCTCVSLRPRSFSLAPGETKEVEMSLDLTPRLRLPQGQEVFEASLLPKIKGALPRTQGWLLRGRVRELLKFNPPAAAFGDLIRGQTVPSILVKIETSLPLRKLSTEGKENHVCVSVVQKEPRRFELSVIPADTLPAGPFRLEVPLQPSGEDGKMLPAKELIVMGIMHEDVEPTPSPLILGAVPIGQTAKETIVLKSITGKSFKVEKIQPLSNDLRVDLIEKGDRKEPMFVVSQKGTTVGDQWTEALFRVQIENQPSRDISLRIFYFGQEKAQKAVVRSEKH